MTVFAAGKKMKNARIIQAQAGGRGGNYLCGGGEEVIPNCLQLFKHIKPQKSDTVFSFS